MKRQVSGTDATRCGDETFEPQTVCVKLLKAETIPTLVSHRLAHAMNPTNSSNHTSPPPHAHYTRTPVCLVLGMAGSGKTTLVDAISSWLEDEQHITHAVRQLNISPSELPPETHAQTQTSIPADPILTGDGSYVINLDPAVYELPYEPNIDIRDTVKYKQVMSEYSLGPNGAIITSLNLYATRFDQVLSLVENRAKDVKAVIVDTPGQIETFTWSASGTIITDALAMVLPTVIVYVIDTKRCESAMTFVSNMLYACSIMYKTRLPMVIAFNKVDVISCKFAQAWMQDFDSFDAVLKEENFVGTLARSMALALEEFYQSMRTVGVSAQTGEGLFDLLRCVKEATDEYEREYRPVVEERKKAKAEKDAERMKRDVEEFRKDAADEIGSDMTTAESVRLAKMRGSHVDDEQETRDYEEFLRKLAASKASETPAPVNSSS